MFRRSTLWRIDYRMIAVILALMTVSLLVISSSTGGAALDSDEQFFTPVVKSQIQWFILGTGIFSICAAYDYNKLREWCWILYLVMLVALIGLFFTNSIQRVHRWYRIPIINVGFQPSEFAKLVVVIAVAWFLERRKAEVQSVSTLMGVGLIVGIPFLLILKQPDLGSAMVLCPVTLVMFYLGGVHPLVTRILCSIAVLGAAVAIMILMGVIDHDAARPYATRFLKEYQYDRLDPNDFHQRQAATAIAVGGFLGTGWRQSEFTAGGWLPKPDTDSVFPAFAEEFGFVGMAALMGLFYLLIYLSFSVTTVAKDHFGQLLAAGVATYLAVHILVNIGMMCGFVPVTGVPLILITYGGSSVFFTMAALGILQSIYSRRFMF